MNFRNLLDNISISELLKTLFYWVAIPIIIGVAIVAMGSSTYHVGGDYPSNLYLGIFFAIICFGLAIVSFFVILIRFIVEVILPIFGKVISKENTTTVILLSIPVIIFIVWRYFFIWYIWYISN